MSYRGSWVTEYVYCHECRRRMWLALCAVDGATATQGGSIISGYLRDTDNFSATWHVVAALQLAGPCHPVRLVILAEDARELVVEAGEGTVRVLLKRGEWHTDAEEVEA